MVILIGIGVYDEECLNKDPDLIDGIFSDLDVDVDIHRLSRLFKVDFNYTIYPDYDLILIGNENNTDGPWIKTSKERNRYQSLELLSKAPTNDDGEYEMHEFKTNNDVIGAIDEEQGTEIKLIWTQNDLISFLEEKAKYLEENISSYNGLIVVISCQ